MRRHGTDHPVVAQRFISDAFARCNGVKQTQMRGKAARQVVRLNRASKQHVRLPLRADETVQSIIPFAAIVTVIVAANGNNQIAFADQSGELRRDGQARRAFPHPLFNVIGDVMH